MATPSTSEKFVVDQLQTLGLRAEPFTKDEQRIQGRKTPDFRVFKGAQFEFYCEVKEIVDTEPLEAFLTEVAPGVKRASQFGDPRSPVNRVLRKIDEAIDQFESIDPERKELRVLALVNTYDLAGPEILQELVKGFLETDSGLRYVTTPPFIRERMASIVREVDFYWWLENHSFKPQVARIAAHPIDSATFQRLYSLFEPSSGGGPP